MTTDDDGDDVFVPDPLEPFDEQCRINLFVQSPPDPLPFEAAAHLCARVVTSTIFQCSSERRTSREIRESIDDTSSYAEHAPVAAPIVAWIRAEGVTHCGRIGQRIAEQCVGGADQRQAFHGTKIGRLVAVSLAVALMLVLEDATLAEALNEHSWYEGEPIADEQDPLEMQLASALSAVAVLPDMSHTAAAVALYDRAIIECSAEHRIDLMELFVAYRAKECTPIDPLYPFLFRDPDEHVVAATAKCAATIWSTDTDDPLAGVRALTGWARALAPRDALRATAVFAGLLNLDDRRVYDHVGPCWRLLSAAMRERLLQLVELKHTAPFVEWLLAWLEDGAGDEYGRLLWYLRGVPVTTRSDGVTERRRALSVWSDSTATRSAIVRQWSFDEYASGIRPRLLAIAANARDPGALLDLLTVWGVDEHVQDSASIFRSLRVAQQLGPTSGAWSAKQPTAANATSTPDEQTITSYRARNAAAQAAFDAGSTDETESALLSLERIVLRQLERAEEALGGVPDGTKAVRRLMYAPWPIGYLHGRLRKVLTPMRQETETGAYGRLAKGIFEASFPGLVALEMQELTWCLCIDPDYEAGMQAVHEEMLDALFAPVGKTIRSRRLADWLVEQGRRSVP